jgi:hypothetical protein
MDDHKLNIKRNRVMLKKVIITSLQMASYSFVRMG